MALPVISHLLQLYMQDTGDVQQDSWLVRDVDHVLCAPGRLHFPQVQASLNHGSPAKYAPCACVLAIQGLFAWGVAMVSSRAFTLRGEKYLVPFADMFNYAPRKVGTGLGLLPASSPVRFAPCVQRPFVHPVPLCIPWNAQRRACGGGYGGLCIASPLCLWAMLATMEEVRRCVWRSLVPTSCAPIYCRPPAWWYTLTETRSPASSCSRTTANTRPLCTSRELQCATQLCTTRGACA